MHTCVCMQVRSELFELPIEDLVHMLAATSDACRDAIATYVLHQMVKHKWARLRGLEMGMQLLKRYTTHDARAPEDVKSEFVYAQAAMRIQANVVRRQTRRLVVNEHTTLDVMFPGIYGSVVYVDPATRNKAVKPTDLTPRATFAAQQLGSLTAVANPSVAAASGLTSVVKDDELPTAQRNAAAFEVWRQADAKTQLSQRSDEQRLERALMESERRMEKALLKVVGDAVAKQLAAHSEQLKAEVSGIVRAEVARELPTLKAAAADLAMSA